MRKGHCDQSNGKTAERIIGQKVQNMICDDLEVELSENIMETP